MPNRFAPVIDFTTTTSPDASTLSSGSATLTPTTFDYQHSHREELTTIVTVKDGKLPVIHFSPIEMASTLTCGDPSSTPDGQPTRTSTPPSSHSSPASSTPLIHHSRFSSSEPVIPTGSSMPGQQPSSTPLPPGSPHPPGSTSATSSAMLLRVIRQVAQFLRVNRVLIQPVFLNLRPFYPAARGLAHRLDLCLLACLLQAGQAKQASKDHQALIPRLPRWLRLVRSRQLTSRPSLTPIRSRHWEQICNQWLLARRLANLAALGYTDISASGNHHRDTRQ